MLSIGKLNLPQIPGSLLASAQEAVKHETQEVYHWSYSEDLIEDFQDFNLNDNRILFFAFDERPVGSAAIETDVLQPSIYKARVSGKCIDARDNPGIYQREWDTAKNQLIAQGEIDINDESSKDKIKIWKAIGKKYDLDFLITGEKVLVVLKSDAIDKENLIRGEYMLSNSEAWSGYNWTANCERELLAKLGLDRYKIIWKDIEEKQQKELEGKIREEFAQILKDIKTFEQKDDLSELESLVPQFELELLQILAWELELDDLASEIGEHIVNKYEDEGI